MNEISSSPISKVFKPGLHLLYWLQIMLLTGVLLVVAAEETIGYFVKWAVISFPFKIALFYSYFYFFIPKWLGKRNWHLFGITLLLLMIYPPLKYLIDEFFGIHSIQSVAVMVEDAEDLKTAVDYLQEWSRRIITVFLNVVMAFIIRFGVDWFRNRRIQSQLEKLQLQSELAMLRNQINPHFLFNTLNNIDSMVYKVSQEASEAIMKLSGIMRYMLYESNTDLVPLKQEVEYLHSYFDLQLMRFVDKENIKLDTDLENEQVRIAPMLFIPFVENAFKHANAAEGNIRVTCSITQKEKLVQLKVVNSFDSALKTEKDVTGGIGLQNVQRRLGLLYPDHHDLKIDSSDGEYCVALTIQLHEN